MRITTEVAKQAAYYLATVDTVLAPVIMQVGICTVRPHTNYYAALVREIIGQQLSVRAANTIEQRFRGLFNGSLPAAEQIITIDVERLRTVGLSRAKAVYIHDLAQHILDGKIQFERFDELHNEEIITELTTVKGIGVWTAHMFLLFCMGRSDVLPIGDLGVRNGIRTLYGFSELPSSDQIISLALENKWHPYESIASWYIWQSLNNTPVTTATS
jgi:DNA-3-methyladenine glycosylase II